MKLLSLLLLFPGIVFGQDTVIEREYEIQYGTLPNIESGSESVLGVSFTSRLANFTFLQLYLGGLFYGTFLHEHFGHNLRASEFGLPLDLQYNFPALGGDYVFPVDYNVRVIERQMVVASGLETTSLLTYKAIQELYGEENNFKNLFY